VAHTIGIVFKGESCQTGHSPLEDFRALTPARKRALFLFCLSVLFQLPFWSSRGGDTFLACLVWTWFTTQPL